MATLATPPSPRSTCSDAAAPPKAGVGRYPDAHTHLAHALHLYTHTGQTTPTTPSPSCGSPAPATNPPPNPPSPTDHPNPQQPHGQEAVSLSLVDPPSLS